jgi:hypothetical protein
MTEQDKRRQTLDVVLNGIRLGWLELESTALAPDERKAVRDRVTALVSELREIISRY